MHPTFPNVPFKRIKMHKRRRAARILIAVVIAALFVAISVGAVGTWLVVMR